MSQYLHRYSGTFLPGGCVVFPFKRTSDWRLALVDWHRSISGFGFKIKGTVIVALVAVVIWKLLKGQCKGMIAALVGATVCVMCIGFGCRDVGLFRRNMRRAESYLIHIGL